MNGEIVKFKQRDKFKLPIKKVKSESEGVRLYFELFKNANSATKGYIYQMIGRDLVQNTNARRYINKIETEDALSIFGHAAAKRMRETTKDTAAYYRELAKLIEKYDLEELKKWEEK